METNSSKEHLGLGSQVLVDMHQCKQLPDSPEHLQSILHQAADKIGLTVVKQTNHQYEPVGITSVLVLAESHLIGHTWPERNFLAIDLFTCSSDVDYEAAIESIAKQVLPDNIETHRYHRGVPNGTIDQK